MLTAGKTVDQQTLGWDETREVTVAQRSKEQAHDYRYFPEPDLVPIVLTDSYIEQVRQALPELPLQRERRYVKEYGLSTDQAFALVSDKQLADYFEQATKECLNVRSLANWILVEFSGRLKELGKSITMIGIDPQQLTILINLIEKGEITGRIAKSVADEMVARPGADPSEIVSANPDYQPLNDKDEIKQMVLSVLKENPQSIADFKSGRDKAFAFLVGQVMKMSRGKASPQIVNELLKQQIDTL